MYNRSPRTSFRSPPVSPSRHSAHDPYVNGSAQNNHGYYSGPRGDEPRSPSLPRLNGTSSYPPRDRPAKTYYDPTQEGREQKQSWQSPVQSHRSPVVTKSPYNYPPPLPPSSDRRSFDQDHPSALATTRSHHSPGIPPLPPSPTHSRHSMAPPPPASSVVNERSPQTSPKRTQNPMSFSSILAEDTKPPPPPSPTSIRKSSHHSVLNGHHPTEDMAPLLPPVHSPTRPRHSSTNHSSESQTRPRSASQRQHSRKTSMADKQKFQVPALPAAVPKPKIVVSEKDLQAALNRIDNMDLSEPEDTGFEEKRIAYTQRQHKRRRGNEDLEAQKRKRRRLAQVQKLAMTFGNRVVLAKEDFRHVNEKSVSDEIHQKSVLEEKEKKKVQQRTRRRELQKQRHERDAATLQQKAAETDNQAERERLLKDAQKAEKKVTNTTRLLNGEIPNRDLREATPLGPNLDGGIMGSFQMTEEQSQEPPKKRQRTGGRLKKSKEQKQAEKDAAAAAHAAMERGDELVTIAPKGEPLPVTIRRESSVPRDPSPVGRSGASYNKTYDALYAQIWKDIARNAIPKVHRIKDYSTTTKQSNLRKTAQLASKEARRWQQKTNKSQKDTQARGKRGMREMLSFWKRNEREERDQRKLAEKQELESARKAEADREANRQKRKLNFLISQTELYSHFIGKKVKTDEVEKATNDVAVSDQKIQAGDPNAHTVDLPEDDDKPAAKVTNFEDLDFDNDDETALREAAKANAQHAVQEAQDRARAFNNNGDLQGEFDDGEMNFQNPTSLQNMDVPQPNMVKCQLKEYQLKGLNWLVNLYEQGINGILADEMGLGKTVQSISVMAYLSEVHNIWGPFLVIAPSSTLHNWQQEITRFVPDLKVLPYWGNAKDRKVLRKFWDRKHITYSKDSPFHVLVTSYQLVVQDTQYFQKIRWQYMILDEAQAIKSSQSSRWKSLLGFHCRNRLLLTGTPIQNNMQELWALLHFIMPSLFDSHDEFSDWFSKDIESHAQSNTKLNEDQLKRLHMILKPFMLRRIKKHVQKELGDKIEEDVFCDLTYRQRAYYTNLRNKISIMELIEKAAMGDDQDSATLMNLVMQFRKVCNHPDLFERAEVMSPVSFGYFAETASFMREGHNVEVLYSVRNLIEYKVPRLIGRDDGRLDVAGPDNVTAGWRRKFLYHDANIWSVDRLAESSKYSGPFSWLRFIKDSPSRVSAIAHSDLFERAVKHYTGDHLNPIPGMFGDDDKENVRSYPSMLNIADDDRRSTLPTTFNDGPLYTLMNVGRQTVAKSGIAAVEPSMRPAASAPPIDLHYSSQASHREKQQTFFNVPMRRTLFGLSEKTENLILDSKLDRAAYPVCNMLPAPNKLKSRYTNIQCPSMRRFVTDSGKLAKLDQLLRRLKEGGHRVLLYFQMTRMIDLMEEYLTYRNYRYCRLDGSTKLEDRRDTVADFQTQPDIFVFLLSTRAGGLGINLTAADTVIFYDSDWNPTIDSQAMDRAHRLGQTRQVTVYRMITRGTIEERIRRRALQKEEVQRVVIQGGAGATVDFNARSRENRTKDIAMWLADDDQAAEIEKKEAELKEKEEREGPSKGKKKSALKKGKEISLDDMYHEGEGHFDDNSNKPSGAATPVVEPPKKRKGTSKKAKTAREKLAIIDGTA